jgi:hypothetical protein
MGIYKRANCKPSKPPKTFPIVCNNNNNNKKQQHPHEEIFSELVANVFCGQSSLQCFLTTSIA